MTKSKHGGPPEEDRAPAADPAADPDVITPVLAAGVADPASGPASGPAIAAALDELAQLAGRPVEQHVEVYERAHSRLQAAMADADEA